MELFIDEWEIVNDSKYIRKKKTLSYYEYIKHTYNTIYIILICIYIYVMYINSK